MEQERLATNEQVRVRFPAGPPGWVRRMGVASPGQPIQVKLSGTPTTGIARCLGESVNLRLVCLLRWVDHHVLSFDRTRSAMAARSSYTGKAPGSIPGGCIF